MRAKQKERRGDNTRKRETDVGTITLTLERVMSWPCVSQLAVVLNYTLITHHYRGKDRSGPVQTAERSESLKHQQYAYTKATPSAYTLYYTLTPKWPIQSSSGLAQMLKCNLI